MEAVVTKLEAKIAELEHIIDCATSLSNVEERIVALEKTARQIAERDAERQRQINSRIMDGDEMFP